MKKISFLIICFFVGILSVSAKEINFYFYPNGGNITTNGFELTSDGYLHYGTSYYAKYASKDTISHINSIAGVTFSLKKTNTSLVKGREWYFENYNDGKTYFISESKSYKVDDVLKILINGDDFYAIDLYANWKNKNIKGIDLVSSSSKPSPSPSKIESIKIKKNSKLSKLEVYDKVQLEVVTSSGKKVNEKITYSSSKNSIARATPKGRVIGINPGEAVITAKTASGKKATIKVTVVKKKKNVVGIVFHTNEGIVKKHSDIAVGENGTLYFDTEIQPIKIDYDSKLSDGGLINYNNKNYLYITKNGYIVESGKEWNTKPDGSGKSYNQNKAYKASDFCDASKNNCSVHLYVNWKKDVTNKIHFIRVNGDSILLESNGKYGLIDTGTDTSFEKIKNYLKKIGVKELEFLIISHNHNDHTGSAVQLASYFNIKKLYMKTYTNQDETSEVNRQIYKNIQSNYNGRIVYIDKDPTFRESAKGSRFIMLGEMKVYFYNTAQRFQVNKPSGAAVYTDYYSDSYYSGISENYNSIVNLVVVNGHKILLTADMESPTIMNGLFKKRILAYNIKTLDVFKIPHHACFNCVGYKRKDEKTEWSMPINVKYYVTTSSINKKHSSYQDLNANAKGHEGISEYLEAFTQKDKNGKEYTKYVNSCFYNLMGNDKKKAKEVMCKSYYTVDSKEAVIFDYSRDSLKITGTQGYSSSRCK